MVTIKEQLEQNAPRFMKLDCKVVYNLFDAFVQKALLEDKAIDFSKPVVTREDGSYEFACREEKFSDVISGNFRTVSVKIPAGPKKPAKPKKKDDMDQAKYDRLLEEYGRQMDEYRLQLEAFAPVREAAEQKKREVLQPKALLYAHLYWLWTLGAANLKTTCGDDNLEILGFEESGDAFTGKIGLWAAKVAGKKHDLDFICNVLFRYATLKKEIKAIFRKVGDVKSALATLCGKVMTSENINMRNGLLHLCDPDSFIHLYSVEDKMKVVDQYKGALHDFKDPYNKSLVDHTLCYKNEKLGYRLLTTEAQICHIDKALRSADVALAMSQEEYWTRHFYSFDDKKSREEAVLRLNPLE